MSVTFDLAGAANPPAPRDAATVIVVREGLAGGAPEIFFVKRNAGVRFMGGAMVFPGGRLDPGDADAVPGDLDETACARALGEAAPGLARALYVAALRECWEESGIALTTTPASPEAVQRVREALKPREAPPIGALLRAEGLSLALGQLRPYARWVTPRAETRRFDARFFLATVDRASTEHAAHDGSETVDSVWLTAREALARAERAEIVLAPPTWRTVAELASLASLKPLAGAQAPTPSPQEPAVELRGEQLCVVLPPAMPVPWFAQHDTNLPNCFAYNDGVWAPLR